jgi:ribose/xylose/arabinose/galactoside ABC-type transport system permease subunit
MSATAGTLDGARTPAGDAASAFVRRHAWTLSLVALLGVLLLFTKLIQPSYGAAGIQSLAISVLPLALAAVAQAIVVISGGIDLSVGWPSRASSPRRC